MCHNNRSRGHAQAHISVCAAPGTVCRNQTQMLSPKIFSRFCRYHACRRVVGGRACPTAKYPGEALCREHMRCTAVENGMSCSMSVKDGNSERFQFCAEFHLCTYPNCDSKRVRRNGEDLQFCNNHRCDHDNCRNTKDAGYYCKFHTCEDMHCTSFVSGMTDRFCERHRRCAKPSCSRFCHVRVNGVSSPYCGAHYCEFTDCDNDRDAGAHCVEHTCGEPGCERGVEAAKGMYCKGHECKTTGCRMKRIGRQYCPYHECVFDGCEAEAETNRYCGRHQRYPGDSRDRHQYGMGCATFEARYDDYQDYNDRAACDFFIDRSTRCYESHVCEFRGCLDVQVPTFEYCRNHKCAVPECHRTRRTSMLDVHFEVQFCESHACHQAGCYKRVVEGSRTCFEHRGYHPAGVRMGVDIEEQEDLRCPAHRIRGECGGHQRRGGCGGNRVGRNAFAVWETGCRGQTMT